MPCNNYGQTLFIMLKYSQYRYWEILDKKDAKLYIIHSNFKLQVK